MLRFKANSRLSAALALGGVLAGMMLYGCKSGSNPSTAPTGDAATPSSAFALFGPPPQKSGVQLWSENCARCHNMRPPDEFSGAQWDVIVHHMRLRANLTGAEARDIVTFLQASH
jgi:hypothetical protein